MNMWGGSALRPAEMPGRAQRAGLLVLFVLSICTPAWGRVGGPCVNCHTMHNSQGGSTVVVDSLNGNVTRMVGVGTGAQAALLITDCVGCHSSTDAKTINDLGDGTRIPIVYNQSEPTYPPVSGGSDTTALAGGNFYWVAQGDDTKGHNVFGIVGRDPLPKAPGTSTGCKPCHQSLVDEHPTGMYETGCKGCHVPRHHADDTLPGAVAGGGALAGGFYRFLGDTMEGHVFPVYEGVTGEEDPDWEQRVTFDSHNIYKGTVGLDTGSGINEGSIGDFCAGCHADFHTYMQDGSNAWIRHPSDVVLPSTGTEYDGYKTYNPLVPVAVPDLDPAALPVPGEVRPGTDIVTCISCHRPHGSPNPDMLRWNYDSCQAGAGDGTKAECGCFVCHTKKDDL